MNHLYSHGYNEVREKWQTPPGTDVDYVKSLLPTPDEVITQFENVDISSKSVEQISIEKNNTDLQELWNTPLQDVQALDPKLVAQYSQNNEIVGQLKSMFKSMKKGYGASIHNGRLRIAYDIPDGDAINMVFDLRKNSSDDKNGLKISEFYQTNPSGSTLDMMTIMPGAEMRYTKVGWLESILRPSIGTAAMGINENKVKVLSGFFKYDVYKTKLTPAELLGHEAAHNWFKTKYPELTYKSKESIISTMGIRGLDIASILLAIGISPWYLFPSLVANLGGYAMSRNRYNKLGENYHALLANESHSSYTQAVFSDFLARKGFMIGTESKNIDEVASNFLGNYMLGYQPISWAIIDLVRTIASNPKAMDKELQPKLAN